MKNNKGFTLIELLAVIIILAIIAVITTPIILNVVDQARQDAAKDKAWGTIDAVRIAYAQDQVATEGSLTDSNNTITFTESGMPNVGGTTVKVNGEKPTSGTVKIELDGDKAGTITCNCLKFGNYWCTTTDGNSMTCKRGDSCSSAK